MHPGMGRIWVHFAINCNLPSTLATRTVPFIIAFPKQGWRKSFPDHLYHWKVNFLFFLSDYFGCFHKEAEILKIAGSSLLLHKTLIIHSSVIQPDVQNTWPHVELLSHKEFTGWLFTSVWLVMLILTDGITNILAIRTEFYEKSIVVSLKWLKCHRYKEHCSFPLC